MRTGWEKVGTIFVDAGIVMVGDPCYTQGADATYRSASWMDFLEKTFPKTFGPDKVEGTQLPDVAEVRGEEGIGLVIESGYGDGEYPVYVRRENSRVKEIRVQFFE